VTMGKGRYARGLACAAGAAAACFAIFAADVDAANPPSWSAPVAADSASAPTGHLVGVSCASTSLCVGVDQAGNVITSTTPTSSAWQQDTATTISHTPTSISCHGGSFCVVGETGAIASATAPSGTWTQATVDGAHTIEGIACPSTTLCVAVDNAGNALYDSSPPTGGWTTESVGDGTTALDAISCPTTSSCAAAPARGSVLTSTSPTSGQAWTKTSLTTAALTAVSCNSSLECVATDADGDVFASANASASPVTWSATYSLDKSNQPRAVSCVDSGLCVVVDGGGVAYSSDDATAAQPTWTPATIDQGHALTAVSCIDAGLCLAVDSSGYAVSAVASPPTATTGSGSASTQTTATLTGTLDPGDAALTGCQFDYGTTTAYGASVPCATTPTAGGGAQSVSAQISGLAAGTAYHFALVAATAVGSGSGADASFATPAAQKASPSLSGSPAVGNTLTCNPNFTANGSETLAFQWLSNTTPIAGATAQTYLVPASEEGDHLSCSVTVAGDGGSTTATSGFDAIPAQAGAKVAESFAGTDKHSGDSVSVPVTCSAQAVGSCTFTLTLTTPETVAHKTKAAVVGSSTTKVAAGSKRTLSVSLSAAGRSLLARKHRLAITAALKGTLIGVLVATLQTDKLTFTDAKATTHAKTTKHHRTAHHAGARAR
jgi:hypothetical protein